ncbi:uncharacterized protein BDZ99DRAFT_499019 [Mytilinidion resinicola]|uniref:Uncharacterized protein n=1 Tax=Mytilinidion resinicola TaxID=574789 RepID=A0A6A6YLG8_9PEZI|nr:uncharacterized protein BDZ99DRAFT_499019 [Mytilinidion resinicola]KAF2809722.1 hypothetical protein BDZ99DRAFT_499019 [Mytilinidion resinicola]
MLSHKIRREGTNYLIDTSLLDSSSTRNSVRMRPIRRSPALPRCLDPLIRGHRPKPACIEDVLASAPPKAFGRRCVSSYQLLASYLACPLSRLEEPCQCVDSSYKGVLHLELDRRRVVVVRLDDDSISESASFDGRVASQIDWASIGTGRERVRGSGAHIPEQSPRQRLRCVVTEWWYEVAGRGPSTSDRDSTQPKYQFMNNIGSLHQPPNCPRMIHYIVGPEDLVEEDELAMVEGSSRASQGV